MAQTRQLATPSYLVGAGLLLIPPFDAIMQTLPLRMADPRWRFGFFGLTSNAMMLTSAGLLIIFLTADYFEHRRFQRVLGIVSIIMAVVIILVSGMFTLDVLQVRRDILPRGQLAFKVASITALAKWLLSIVTFGTFGLASLRTPKAPKTAKEKRATGALLMGNKPGAAPAPSLPAAESASARTE